MALNINHTFYVNYLFLALGKNFSSSNRSDKDAGFTFAGNDCSLS